MCDHIPNVLLSSCNLITCIDIWHSHTHHCNCAFGKVRKMPCHMKAQASFHQRPAIREWPSIQLQPAYCIAWALLLLVERGKPSYWSTCQELLLSRARRHHTWAIIPFSTSNTASWLKSVPLLMLGPRESLQFDTPAKIRQNATTYFTWSWGVVH